MNHAVVASAMFLSLASSLAAIPVPAEHGAPGANEKAEAAAAPAAWPSCRDGFVCPNAPGSVMVSLANFDGSGALANRPGVLDSDEIQCAMDCLDGVPDPDHVLRGPTPPATSTPVPGGRITFDAGVEYQIQRSVQLPAMTAGPMIVEGSGARLRIERKGDQPIAIFERRAPPAATNCDVESMSVWAMLWTFRDLVLHGGGSVADAGIVIHGSNSLTIERCSFGSLGVGVDLRFGLLPVIEQCMFINNRRHDIMLGPGNAECGPSGSCYDACTRGSTVFTKAGSNTRQLVEGGCNGALITHCRFVLHSQQLASIRVRNSRAVVIEGAGFDGYRGKHAIHYTHPLADALTVRDLYFETNIASDDAMILVDGAGRLLLDGVHLETGVKLVLVDTAASSGTSVVVRHASWMPGNVVFRNGPNAWRNEWRLEDVLAADLADPARWTGGPPPLALVADRASARTLASTAVSGVLRVPLRGPDGIGQKPQDGQIWFDAKTRKLMFCCDDVGRPRPVGR